jgi:hypothetical protein
MLWGLGLDVASQKEVVLETVFHFAVGGSCSFSVDTGAS